MSLLTRREQESEDDGLSPMEKVYKAEKERLEQLAVLEAVKLEAMQRKRLGRRDSLVDQLTSFGQLDIEKKRRSVQESAQLVLRL